MRILITLYYYRPHFSGLTVYTERLARTLAARGHQVTVLTSRYNRALPALEVEGNLTVRRLPVALRLSKGVVLPTMLLWTTRLLAHHDVLLVHVPQLDAAPAVLTARALGRPAVMTYHCDLRLPPSPLNALANLASRLADRLTAAAAHAIVTNTRDYAEASPLLRRHLEKLHVIPPPVEMPPVDPQVVASMRRRFALEPGQRLIGMAARLATEKGVEVLARAMPALLERFPTARVLYVGQHLGVLGEEDYARRLAPLLEQLGAHWTFLGVLEPQEMAAFFSLCEVTVLPSLNSTESFGMVQVESMVCGTPVVASDLPGVREPTQRTAMGLTAPPGDAPALAEAIAGVLEQPARYGGDPDAVARLFSPARVAQAYEELFEGLLARGARTAP